MMMRMMMMMMMMMMNHDQQSQWKKTGILIPCRSETPKILKPKLD